MAGKVFDLVATGVLVLCVTFLSLDWTNKNLLPDLSGKLAPVVSTLRVDESSVRASDAGVTVFSGEARKYRDCSWRSVEWFLGPVGGMSVPALARFLDPPQLRRAGVVRWEGIEVQISTNDLLHNSHAYVVHRCPLPRLLRPVLGHFAPWNTRSLYYDASKRGGRE